MLEELCGPDLALHQEMGEVYRARDTRLDRPVAGAGQKMVRAEPWGTVPIMPRALEAPYALHPDGERIAAASVTAPSRPATS